MSSRSLAVTYRTPFKWTSQQFQPITAASRRLPGRASNANVIRCLATRLALAGVDWTRIQRVYAGSHEVLTRMRLWEAEVDRCAVLCAFTSSRREAQRQPRCWKQ